MDGVAIGQYIMSVECVKQFIFGSVGTSLGPWKRLLAPASYFKLKHAVKIAGREIVLKVK